MAVAELHERVCVSIVTKLTHHTAVEMCVDFLHPLQMQRLHRKWKEPPQYNATVITLVGSACRTCVGGNTVPSWFKSSAVGTKATVKLMITVFSLFLNILARLLDLLVSPAQYHAGKRWSRCASPPASFWPILTRVATLHFARSTILLSFTLWPFGVRFTGRAEAFWHLLLSCAVGPKKT